MIRYPEKFQARVKILCPNDIVLHRLMEAGDVGAGYRLKNILEAKRGKSPQVEVEKLIAALLWAITAIAQAGEAKMAHDLARLWPKKEG